MEFPEIFVYVGGYFCERCFSFISEINELQVFLGDASMLG